MIDDLQNFPLPAYPELKPDHSRSHKNIIWLSICFFLITSKINDLNFIRDLILQQN